MTNPIEQRNARLTEWLQEKLAGRHVRFCEDRTALFDE